MTEKEMESVVESILASSKEAVQTEKDRNVTRKDVLERAEGLYAALVADIADYYARAASSLLDTTGLLSYSIPLAQYKAGLYEVFRAFYEYADARTDTMTHDTTLYMHFCDDSDKGQLIVSLVLATSNGTEIVRKEIYVCGYNGDNPHVTSFYDEDKALVSLVLLAAKTDVRSCVMTGIQRELQEYVDKVRQETEQMSAILSDLKD